MNAVVEFHGFKDNNNRFVIKEFAVVSKHFKTVVIFDAPYSKNLLNAKMLKTAHWLSRNFHYIKWEERGIPYDEDLIRAICKPFLVIYTSGLEKANYLREFHFNVKQIPENIKSSKCTAQSTCILLQHNSLVAKCAVRSASCLYDLIASN